MIDRVAALAAAVLLCACGEAVPSHAQGEAAPEGSLFAAEPDRQWRLPESLREISGLAVTSDGRLFGHDDEVAILYELDVEDGAIVKRFALGDPAERGDFEAIAITPEGDFYLIESRGRLYRFREGDDGAVVDFERFNTGLRDVCEIEGLAHLPADASLIVACKTNQARRMKDSVALYAWSTEDAGLRPWLTLPAEPLVRAAGVRGLNPSGIDIDAHTGRIVLVAARGRLLIELDADGEPLSLRRLAPAHAQVEGAAILPDGSLVLADEDRGSGALLSRYPRASHE